MLNLDTHIVIDFLRGQLSPLELKVVQNKVLAISDIVLWEIEKLRSLKRIELNTQNPFYLDFIDALHVYPITPAIAERACRLDFKSDPADEIIAATSLIHKIPLLTRDKKIKTSKLIRFA